MLSYLHAFHAGNFADVHKHAALTLAIAMMQAKPSAIACFDTHAGSAATISRTRGPARLLKRTTVSRGCGVSAPAWLLRTGSRCWRC